MSSDIRDSLQYRQMAAYYRDLYEPGFGAITYAEQVAVSPDQRWIAFTGSILESLSGTAKRCIGIADAQTGDVRRLTFGGGSSLSPRWSPCGRRLAFLSDRDDAGFFQPYLIDLDRPSEAMPLPRIEGVAEYLEWSPNGRRLLIGVAGAGAELSGMQGSTTTASHAATREPWMPTVQSGFSDNEWRRAHVLEVESGRCVPVSATRRNVWEACWCGDGKLLAVVSAAPDEAAWYTAELAIIDIVSGVEHVVHRPQDQFGVPAASPSGTRLAVIHAVCSDRSIVAGDLLVGTREGLRTVSTLGTDVTHLAWRDDRRVVAIGVRNFQTVIVEYDCETDQAREIWASDDLHCGFWYPAVAPFGRDGCAFIAEGYLHPPALVTVDGGVLRRLAMFSHANTDALLGEARYGDRVENVSWQARDGLEIQGTLILPRGRGPYPTIVEVHGGPIWMQRSRWMSGIRAEPQALVHRGFAVFRPNPRGSGGRGQSFARRVVGDMGGLDTHDLLSGVDALVARGIADGTRLGVMGVSYGGYMSAWIVTQDARFRASIPISPVTDWVSMQWTSNVPHFVEQFLDRSPLAPGGLYHARSPINFADRVRTPTLLVAGSLDRISPPEQAVEFYRALRRFAAPTELVIYPQEGHNVRNMPATVDASARYLAWFERHLGIDGSPAS